MSKPKEYRVSAEAVQQLVTTFSEPGAAPRVFVDWLHIWVGQCLVPVEGDQGSHEGEGGDHETAAEKTGATGHDGATTTASAGDGSNGADA